MAVVGRGLFFFVVKRIGQVAPLRSAGVGNQGGQGWSVLVSL